MSDEQIKICIGNNIAAYRKEKGWTQAGLAERLSYSDKAISKWERGESIPDVITLIELAKLFEISLDKLVSLNDDLPQPKPLFKADRRIILLLCDVLVCFVALLFFVALQSFSTPFSWIPFVFAIPICAIVELSIRSAWKDFHLNKLLISLIAWGSLASIFLVLRVIFGNYYWLLFLLGIPGQLAIILWFRMFKPVELDLNEVTDGQE